MKNSAVMLCFVLIAVLFLAGCTKAGNSGENLPPEEVVVMAPETPPAPATADPAAALDAIYAEFSDSIYEVIDAERLREIIGITVLPASEVYARYSDPKGGVVDVVIAKPEYESTIDVREALYRYRDRRVAEFEHYDVLGAHEIAQNAMIYEHGEYIILLMTADNDAAQIVIDKYIPL